MWCIIGILVLVLSHEGECSVMSVSDSSTRDNDARLPTNFAAGAFIPSTSHHVTKSSAVTHQLHGGPLVETSRAHDGTNHSDSLGASFLGQTSRLSDASVHQGRPYSLAHSGHHDQIITATDNNLHSFMIRTPERVVEVMPQADNAPVVWQTGNSDQRSNSGWTLPEIVPSQALDDNVVPSFVGLRHSEGHLSSLLRPLTNDPREAHHKSSSSSGMKDSPLSSSRHHTEATGADMNQSSRLRSHYSDHKREVKSKNDKHGDKRVINEESLAQQRIQNNRNVHNISRGGTSEHSKAMTNSKRGYSGFHTINGFDSPEKPYSGKLVVNNNLEREIVRQIFREMESNSSATGHGNKVTNGRSAIVSSKPVSNGYGKYNKEVREISVHDTHGNHARNHNRYPSDISHVEKTQDFRLKTENNVHLRHASPQLYNDDRLTAYHTGGHPVLKTYPEDKEFARQSDLRNNHYIGLSRDRAPPLNSEYNSVEEQDEQPLYKDWYDQPHQNFVQSGPSEAIPEHSSFSADDKINTHTDYSNFQSLQNGNPHPDATFAPHQAGVHSLNTIESSSEELADAWQNALEGQSNLALSNSVSDGRFEMVDFEELGHPHSLSPSIDSDKEIINSWDGRSHSPEGLQTDVNHTPMRSTTSQPVVRNNQHGYYELKNDLHAIHSYRNLPNQQSGVSASETSQVPTKENEFHKSTGTNEAIRIPETIYRNSVNVAGYYPGYVSALSAGNGGPRHFRGQSVSNRPLSSPNVASNEIETDLQATHQINPSHSPGITTISSPLLDVRHKPHFVSPQLPTTDGYQVTIDHQPMEALQHPHPITGQIPASFIQNVHSPLSSTFLSPSAPHGHLKFHGAFPSSVPIGNQLSSQLGHQFPVTGLNQRPAFVRHVSPTSAGLSRVPLRSNSPHYVQSKTKHQRLPIQHSIYSTQYSATPSRLNMPYIDGASHSTTSYPGTGTPVDVSVPHHNSMPLGSHQTEVPAHFQQYSVDSLGQPGPSVTENGVVSESESPAHGRQIVVSASHQKRAAPPGKMLSHSYFPAHHGWHSHHKTANYVHNNALFPRKVAMTRLRNQLPQSAAYLRQNRPRVLSAAIHHSRSPHEKYASVLNQPLVYRAHEHGARHERSHSKPIFTAPIMYH